MKNKISLPALTDTLFKTKLIEKINKDIKKRLLITLQVLCVAIFSLTSAGSSAQEQPSGIDKTPKAGSFIAGGEVAPKTPYVILITGSNGQCTAVQLSKDYLLTARHCASKEGYGPDDYYWVVAVYDPINHTDREGLTFDSYAPEGDAALLKLERPHPLKEYGKMASSYYNPPIIPSSESIPPNTSVCIPPNTDVGRVMGYGFRGDVLESDGVLYQAEGYMVGNQTNPNFGVFGGEFLTYKSKNGRACKGDSGSPLFIKNQATNQDEIVGVDSMGRTPCLAHTTDPWDNIFANLTIKENLAWIKGKLEN